MIAKKAGPTLRLRAELLDVEPLVWRRLLLPAGMTLKRLHDVIQTAFGWQDYHLHEYRHGESLRIGLPEVEEDFEEGELGAPVQDERRWTVDQLARATGGEALYVYDFGDEWRHRLVFEGAERQRPDVTFAPLCLAGENACPPEDVGGPWGYKHFLESLADPEHEEHEQWMDWIGGVFDPRGFDLNRVNADLHRLRSRRR